MKVLKECSDKYDAPRPHKQKEVLSDINKNRTNTVKSDGQTQEIKTMVSRDAIYPKKERVKKEVNNTKSEKDAAVPSEEEHTCGIDRLNLGKPFINLEGHSKL